MTELTRYDEMRRAIAAAHEVDEVKELHDKAAAIEHYHRIARDSEQERKVGEIRVRALRRMGELLKEQEKAKGKLKRGAELPRSTDTTAGAKTLAEQGISKNRS